jgi:hypothetical protein
MHRPVRQRAQQPLDLGGAQDGGHALGPPGALRAEPPQVVRPELVDEHLPVQEHDRAGRLILGRGADPPPGGQMVEVTLHVDGPELPRMPPPLPVAPEPQEIAYPILITPDGRRREPPATPDLVRCAGAASCT